MVNIGIAIPNRTVANNTLEQAQQLFGQGLAFQQNGQLAQAQALYEQLLNLQPNHFGALHYSGLIAYQQENYQLANELLSKAVQLNPNSAAAYSNHGIVLKALKQFSAAAVSYKRAIVINPNHAAVHNNLGNVLLELKQFDAAISSYEHAIAIKPDYAEAYNYRGVALQELKQLDAAVASFETAIAFKPDYADAYNNRGNTLKELKQLDAAVASYDQAIAIMPDFAEAYSNRGSALQELKRLEAAVASFEHAIALKPNFAEAYTNRGNALRELKQLDAAIASHDHAIRITPDLAEAYHNRGMVFHELRQFDAALANYERAIAIKPDFAEAYIDCGSVFQDLNKINDALKFYKEAFKIRPDYEYLYGTIIHSKMKICDWEEIESGFAKLKSKILLNEKVISPFELLGLVDSLELQKKSSEIFAHDRYPDNYLLGAICKRPSREKIRIGYFSADFGRHALSLLTAELYERHDRSKFDIIAFSFGYHPASEIRNRLSKAFDKFIDVCDKNDQEVAQLSRELQIDIAVDLGGYTKNNRTSIFAYRAAPIQVNYLGFPSTMGAGFIDYIIADNNLIKPQFQIFYNEKIVYLPNSYMVNDSQRKLSDRQFKRQDFGLPTTGFVFCCFNNTYKITPAIFDCWMRILKAVDSSVLWLIDDNYTASNNLKKQAELRGVYADRLIFSPKIENSEHLARHKLADLFIDTLPCNAHTTASDALWAGLPVLTCIGEAFASRVAASLLDAIHLPELITRNLEDYERLAIELAINSTKLLEIKTKLENNKFTTPLFDTKLFTKHIEAAYTQMYKRYQADLPPDHIYISP
ncbi:MAG: tetratricopeptide repeat protein [Candidatus Contendobacter sp.]|nr:tetratricopeptide repeat protein [Candidatus Contendobacter sp.]